jgi:hypothetical protein
MKPAIILLISCFPVLAMSQQMQLQFHYDLRHTVDPKHTKKNFPAFYAEYFKAPGPDSMYGFIKPGSFLLKIQSEFSGERNNTGQFYMQISQAFRFWKPGIFMQVQYNGGLGIAEPGAYGYYLTNAFSVGAAYNFQSGNMAFFNFYASYKYTAFNKPSHDVISAFFWLWFFSNYTISFTGNIVVWTENRNHGDPFTATETGKKFSLFGDPQVWFKIYKGLSAGSKSNIYYHILSKNNRFKVYPSVALKYQF